MGEFLKFFINYISKVWFVVLPIAIWHIFKDIWITTIRINYNITKRKWIFLELKVPLFQEKSPLSLEQVFASLHGIYVKGKPNKRIFEGYTPPWYVFELVANDHELKFFIRIEERYLNFVKSRFYSQYPEIEIEVVKDPLYLLPFKIPNKDYDFYGTEFKLSNENYFPIRTYTDFEKGDLKTEQKIDPITLLSEAAGEFSKDEWFVVQIFARPVPGDEDEEFSFLWVEKGKEKINEILKKKEEKEGIFDEILDFTINLLKAPFSPPKFKEKKKEEAQQMTLFQLDPISRLQIEKITEKTSKIGFQCGIRVGYFAKKDIFKKLAGSRIPLIYSIFKSFENTHLNSFSDVKEVRTRAYYYFVERREFQKKRNLYYYLRYFFWTQKKFILNIEELTSVFHFPRTRFIESGIKRTTLKQPAPPSNLPFI
jgi:hypothetical protein